MAELPQPDMSHLTPEERRIIEGVLMRQKEEEEQDHEIMRRKQDEVQVLEETIRMRSEKHKKAGVELNATCHICLKTKFADGVGHICNYCEIRCCARCGGKVTLRSSKVIWVCILCRKKQELLSKTGQWMSKTSLSTVDSALLRQMQEDLQVGGRQGLADQTRDKRPKLERAHSAAEKENLPLLQRSGNCPLRRQYSQQEQISGRRMSTSDSGVEMSVSPHARSLPTPHVVGSYPMQQTPRHPAVYPDDDPNLYRGELDGLMRQHPQNYQRQRSTYQDQGADLGMTYGQTPMETGSVRTTVHPSQQHSMHQTQGGRSAQSASTVGVQQQRSFSSSEEERSTPECASDEPDESEKGDEVIAWNGRSLQGKSFREVYDIITESRLEPQIELVVERKLSTTTTGMAPAGPGPSTPMASRRIVAQSQWRQKHETISGSQPHHKELYDARREKPSVLVTSPGSPDLHAQGRGRHSRYSTGNANVGGSIQVKLGFDPVGLQLIVTIICASGLTPKSNGQPRNPYAKIFLLPDKSEKSKRRTKTVANTNDPRWNQTFVYNGVRRSELRKRALEITVWDYARYEANDFLGEAVLELAVCLLDEEPEWHSLTAHGEHRHVRHYQDSDDVLDHHLSPPSTTSRLSDSDTSECDITDCDVSREQRRTADGASISSIGSSSSHYSSPPPERELCVDGEHRSRRDMSPQGRKRAALMISRDQPATIGSSYQTYRKDDIHRGMMGHRSHSAAPMDSPSVRYRGRSQSPTGHRSLSPPEHRSIPYSHGYVHTTRFGSRSATATPTGSPKKRQLPQIPAALKERVAQDLEERARLMRHRNRQSIYRSTGMGGWERHYSGLSDSDLPSIGHDPLTLSHSHAYRMHRPRKGHLSPEKDVLGDLGDSDMESIASVTSSAFSTQSERPRGSRALIEYSGQSSSYEKTSRHQVTDNGHDGHDKRSQFTRSLSNADVPQDEKDTGSFSDTAIALNVEDASKRGRKSSPGSKSGSGSSSGSAVQYQTGLGKKSNSTSQLSATECGGMIIGGGGAVVRAGLASRKRNSTPSSIQRSEEIMPAYQRFDSKQAGSAASDTAGSLNSISSSEGSSWSPSLRMAGEGQLRDFIEDLGPGQVVGRQALGARCLGEIQLSLSHTKGHLEVEVIRAKDLKAKQGSKVIPAPYVKLYLVNGKRCIEKAKTMMARKTLDPFYQQLLAFKENCRGCILQVTVWGDYGRIEGKKVFMGIAQIVLDELDLNQMVIGWYKLFDTQAL